MPRAGGHGGTSQIGGNHSNFKAQQQRREGIKKAYSEAVAAAEMKGEEPPPLPKELRPGYIDGGSLLMAVVIGLGMTMVLVFMVLKLSGTI
ncbi:MAG: hypothetical protein CMA41_01020 [Euryarchaeota archaeon]|jgi:hypothetical protein|nr:hypothetical protein [Euryarchaeota archaeon]|tara:strand:+ start:202 stop:474 length:273 start_codon:yes stop_codon:yes gene_type:complete